MDNKEMKTTTPNKQRDWAYICELDERLADIYEEQLYLEDQAERLRCEIDLYITLFRKRYGGNA